MKKRILILAVLIVIVISLFIGCNNQKEDTINTKKLTDEVAINVGDYYNTTLESETTSKSENTISTGLVVTDDNQTNWGGLHPVD